MKILSIANKFFKNYNIKIKILSFFNLLKLNTKKCLIFYKNKN